MSAGAPWSVKGIDPKAREIAKDLARRSGMTLGEWLNQMIMDTDEDETVVPIPRRQVAYAGPDRRARYRRFDDAYEAVEERRPGLDGEKVLRVLEALTERIEAAERRSTAAVGGIDQAVAGLLARVEVGERDVRAQTARLEEVSAELRDEKERLRRYERDAGGNPRQMDAIKALETALGKLANQLYEGEARTRATLEEVRGDLTGLGRRIDRVETAPTEDPAVLIDAMVGKIAARLEEAEGRTSGAIRALESSFLHLEERLRAAETRAETPDAPAEDETALRLEQLAEDLSRRVDEARLELIERFDAAADGRFDRVDRAIEDLTRHVDAAERRQAQAIESMGHEVLRIAENLNRRMVGVEQSSARAVGQVSEDVARLADTVEQRVRRAEGFQVDALERLGSEIARIGERLGQRIADAERRATEAVDEVGERLGRTTHSLDLRYERASLELAERIRESEEKTARLLEEAREKIDARLQEAHRRVETTARRWQDEAVTPEARADAEFGLPDPSDRYGGQGYAPVAAVTATGPRIEVDLDDPLFAESTPAVEDDPFAPLRAAVRSGFDPMAAPAPDHAPDPLFARDPFAEDEEAHPGFAPAAPTHETPVEQVWAEPVYETPHDAFPEPRHEPPAPADHGRFDPMAEPAFEDEPFVPSVAAFAQPAEDVAPVYDPTPTEAPFDAPAEPQGATFDATGRGYDELLDGPQRPPVSTREAVEAARAATRLGLKNDDRGGMLGSLKLGGGAKTRLAERVDREAGKGDSTIKKALIASVVATVVTTGAAGGLVIYGDKVLPTEETSGGTLLATSGEITDAADENAAVAPALAANAVAGSSADAQALFEEAGRLLGSEDAEGAELLRQAASLGHAEAAFQLAQLYEQGQAGLPADPREARRWTERAALGGETTAMHNLGLFFFEGKGGPRDQTRAAEWFQRAAERGLIDSQYNLGRLYEQGYGVSADPVRAYQWYLVAAAAGDDEARADAERLAPSIPTDRRRAAERAARDFKPTPDAGKDEGRSTLASR